MESLIGDQSNYELESIYTMEEGLCDKIISPLAEKIPVIFNNLLANPNKRVKEEISEQFNLDDIKISLLNYFQNLDVKDLYLDLKELDNSLKQLEKQELYLYFCEIEIEKRRYPIFYVQMQITEDVTKSSFDLILNNELFINAKAVQYA
jgi:hypothetical protein